MPILTRTALKSITIVHVREHRLASLGRIFLASIHVIHVETIICVFNFRTPAKRAKLIWVCKHRLERLFKISVPLHGLSVFHENHRWHGFKLVFKTKVFRLRNSNKYINAIFNVYKTYRAVFMVKKVYVVCAWKSTFAELKLYTAHDRLRSKDRNF